MVPIHVKRAYAPVTKRDGTRYLVYSAQDKEHNQAVALRELLESR